MAENSKKELFVILILICIISFSVLGYTKYGLHVAKVEFNEMMRIVDEEVPSLMSEALKNDSLIQNVEVTIQSSVVSSEYHDWYNWTEDCQVIYYVSDSFDTLSHREQYEFIGEHSRDIYYVKEKATQELAPQHSRYRSLFTEENDVLRKIYGQTVFADGNYDAYFKTSENTYKYCEVDDLMNINGEEIWVHPDPSEYLTDVPYVGMDTTNIRKTKLGFYTSSELCRDYYSLRPERRSITYYWRNASGDLLFEAYALDGEVISTVDFRVRPIVSHNLYDKLN